MSFLRHPEVSALKDLLMGACLCPGLLRTLKESGLGEPFGKASLANTAFAQGRFIFRRGAGWWPGQGWFGYPSEAWPDEALEKSWPGPLMRTVKKGGGKAN